MANEFFDLFNQLFLSTGVWGYTGVLIVIIGSLIFSSSVKYAWVFCTIGMAMMSFEYFTLGTDYFWHIILLVFGAGITLLLGVKSERK